MGAAFQWEKVGLPPPSIIVSNPVNGHAHISYGLSTPIVKSDAARDAPLRYARAVKSAFLIKLRADPGYSGSIIKNPLHNHWRTIWNNKLYDLGELAEYCELPKTNRKQQDENLLVSGRNCRLFEELRQFAYQWVLQFKRNNNSFVQWRDFVVNHADSLNIFEIPLGQNEVKSVATSVADWVWRHFSPEKFSEIQSARGKRGGRPKTITLNGEPWVQMGVSRATYYRQLKSGLIVPTEE